jgi:hypothetical protein
VRQEDRQQPPEQRAALHIAAVCNRGHAVTTLIRQRSVVQVHLGPPLDHLVRGNFAATPSAAFQSCLSICLSTVPAEQLVHDDRTGLNHRPQLVPVHQFGDRCAAVSDQLRDLLQRHACIGK